ncbi:hypothetical protein ACM9XC_05715 [Xanthomonas sacchari]
MTELTFTAPSYAFLQSTMPCWKCSQATSVVTVWVPSFIDTGDIQKPEDEPEVGGTSTLRYIHALDDQVAAHVRDVAPWLKPGRSETANTIYWANHCEICAAIQGDHFVLGVNGPFFPQTRDQADALQVIPGRGPLAANSSAAQSSWMDWIAERMRGKI